MLSLVARKDIHINIIYVCKGSAFMNIKRKKGQKATPKRPKNTFFQFFLKINTITLDIACAMLYLCKRNQKQYKNY